MKDGKGREETGLYDSLVRYTGVFGGVHGLVTLVNLIRTKIVARLLGTVGFGINESFNRTLNLVKNTADLGIPTSAVRTISSDFEAGADMSLGNRLLVTRSWVLLTAIAGTLLSLLLSPLFGLWAFKGDSLYTLSFVLLSPVVGFSLITGGEMAVMKGTRRLRDLAVSQLISAVMLLAITVPIFYFLRLRGLVLSLVLTSFSAMVVTCVFSFRACPYRVELSRRVLKQGSDMVRVGLSFMIAAAINAGALSIIANYLMSGDQAATVGAYSAGNALVNYLGMFVFASMESDYFSRLSGSIHNADETKSLFNKQIEVAVLLITPAIVLFLTFLEPSVRILLTDKFMTAVPMAQLAVLSLFFKAISLPLAYIPLVKGDSITYIFQELSINLFLVVFVLLGFRFGGLRMIGLGITAAEVCGMIVNLSIVRFRYGLRVLSQTWGIILSLPWTMLAAFVAVSFFSGPVRWIGSALMVVASLILSWTALKRRTSFADTIRQRFR